MNKATTVVLTALVFMTACTAIDPVDQPEVQLEGRAMAVEAGYVEGLNRTYAVESGPVCAELSTAWYDDPRLNIRSRSFGFRYPEGTTPCDEIEPGERWYSSFEGFLRLDAGKDRQVTFIADVNDGMRMAIRSPDGAYELCRMELWRDVPGSLNYHSTDGYDEYIACEANLEPGVHYQVLIEHYHQSEPEIGNPVHNRAYLDLFYRGLRRGDGITYLRKAEETPEEVEYVDGLERTHAVGGNSVCPELSSAWHEDPNLRIRERSFGFAYPQGTTPCADIEPGERWESSFEGFLRMDAADVRDVGFVADVNDGVRMTLMDPTGSSEICRMELWSDVPIAWNYHSTDAFDPDRGCQARLEPGVYYPIRIEHYHQSEPEARNATHNRAYLDMFYRGLMQGESVRFFRPAPDVPQYVDGLQRSYSADGTSVCEELSEVWADDPNLRVRRRSFGFVYPEGETPCSQIGEFTRWESAMSGFLRMDAGGARDIRFVADVNDGVRMTLLNPEGTQQVCRMELWRDVPSGWNYHSTDAFDPDLGCEVTLQPGVYYPILIEHYHESDPASFNAIHNRAYLDMFYRGLKRGEGIGFFRLR